MALTYDSKNIVSINLDGTDIKSVSVKVGTTTTKCWGKRSTLTISRSPYVAVNVSRTSSPYQHASTGSLSNGSYIYYGDKISVTITPNEGYEYSVSGSISLTTRTTSYTGNYELTGTTWSDSGFSINAPATRLTWSYKLVNNSNSGINTYRYKINNGSWINSTDMNKLLTGLDYADTVTVESVYLNKGFGSSSVVATYSSHSSLVVPAFDDYIFYVLASDQSHYISVNVNDSAYANNNYILKKNSNGSSDTGILGVLGVSGLCTEVGYYSKNSESRLMLIYYYNTNDNNLVKLNFEHGICAGNVECNVKQVYTGYKSHIEGWDYQSNPLPKLSTLYISDINDYVAGSFSEEGNLLSKFTSGSLTVYWRYGYENSYSKWVDYIDLNITGGRIGSYALCGNYYSPLDDTGSPLKIGTLTISKDTQVLNNAIYYCRIGTLNYNAVGTYYDCYGTDKSFDQGFSVDHRSPRSRKMCYSKVTDVMKIGGTVKYIPSSGFNLSNIINKLSISNGVQVIGYESFKGCDLPGQGALNLPSSLTTIMDFAFDSCEGITSVTGGSGLSFVGVEVFNGSTLMNSSGQKYIGTYCFLGYGKNSSVSSPVTISDAIRCIAGKAMAYASGYGKATRVYITNGNNLISIGSNAFYDNGYDSTSNSSISEGGIHINANPDKYSKGRYCNFDSYWWGRINGYEFSSNSITGYGTRLKKYGSKTYFI